MKGCAKLLEILFKVILFFHILAGICGLGVSFASPYIRMSARNVRTAYSAHMIHARIDYHEKIGSIVLILTGLSLAFIHPDLFQTGWYLTALVLYILTQPIKGYILPRFERALIEILQQVESEHLPSEYIQMSKKTKPLHITNYILFVLIVLLIVFKPF